MASMLCACGHPADAHVDLVFGCKGTVESRAGLSFCPCKRYANVTPTTDDDARTLDAARLAEISERAERALATSAEAYRLAQEALDMRARAENAEAAIEAQAEEIARLRTESDTAKAMFRDAVSLDQTHIAERDEARRALADALEREAGLVSAVTAGGLCTLCDGFAAAADEQIVHREDCPTRPSVEPAPAGDGGQGCE